MQQMNQFRDQIMSREIGSLIVPAEKVITVKSKWSLEQAFNKLMESGWSSVPVLNDHDEVVGLISKQEILEYARMEKVPFYLDFKRKFVHEGMKKNVPTLRDDTLLRYGIELLVDWPYLPVINTESKFIGILTRRSILDYLLKEFYDSE